MAEWEFLKEITIKFSQEMWKKILQSYKKEIKKKAQQQKQQKSYRSIQGIKCLKLANMWFFLKNNWLLKEKQWECMMKSIP